MRWIVVANTCLSRIYEQEAKGRVKLIKAFEHPESRLHENELHRDGLGRAVERGTGMHHGIGHDLRVSGKEKEVLHFVAEITDYLNDERVRRIRLQEDSPSPSDPPLRNILVVAEQALNDMICGRIKELDITAENTKLTDRKLVQYARKQLAADPENKEELKKIEQKF